MVLNTGNFALKVLAFCLLTTISAQNSDDVLLNIKTMNLDSIVTIPRWMVPQSSPKSLVTGFLPLGGAAQQTLTIPDDSELNDVALVANYITDVEFYQIRLDTNLFSKEDMEMTVVDPQTIQVEVNLKGGSSRVKRRFLVPMSYDVDRFYTEMDKSGILNITVPRKMRKIVGVGNSRRK